MRLGLYTILLLSLWCQAYSAYAQHPIDIERSAARADYFQALVNFEKLPARRATTDSVVAVARSAWGLGLSARAAQEYDRALHDKTLSSSERARILLSRGIIEFQEDRYQSANLFAERAAETLEGKSPLRSQAWTLWGQGLYRLGSYGLAQEKYLRALEEGESEQAPELHYMLGECDMKLGQYEQARAHFEQIPLTHDRAAEGIRQLAEAAMQRHEPRYAIYWLRLGREKFSDKFLDSWVDYTMLSAAASVNDSEAVKSIEKEASERYAPSDFWLSLLQAAAEIYFGNQNNRSKDEVLETQETVQQGRAHGHST